MRDKIFIYSDSTDTLFASWSQTLNGVLENSSGQDTNDLTRKLCDTEMMDKSDI